MASASALMAVGFSNAADKGFTSTASLPATITGAVLLFAAVVHCLVTDKIAVLPPVSRSLVGACVSWH